MAERLVAALQYNDVRAGRQHLRARPKCRAAMGCGPRDRIWQGRVVNESINWPVRVDTDCHREIGQGLEGNGGSDGARTRDLRRDRPAL